VVLESMCARLLKLPLMSVSKNHGDNDTPLHVYDIV